MTRYLQADHPTQHWPEFQVKQLLARYGIPVPNGIVLQPGDELDRVAGLEPPYVVKVHGGQFVHKSDVGGVQLDIVDIEALSRVISEYRQRFGDVQLLVEEQARTGVEFILGVLRDADFGLAIMAGFGGVLTEIYQDVAFRVLPVTRVDCEDMLGQLRASPLLGEYRGKKADRAALIDVMLKLNDVASDWSERLEGMDLNPILVHERGVTVVDAKMIVQGE